MVINPLTLDQDTPYFDYSQVVALVTHMLGTAWSQVEADDFTRGYYEIRHDSGLIVTFAPGSNDGLVGIDGEPMDVIDLTGFTDGPNQFHEATVLTAEQLDPLGDVADRFTSAIRKIHSAYCAYTP